MSTPLAESLFWSCAARSPETPLMTTVMEEGDPTKPVRGKMNLGIGLLTYYLATLPVGLPCHGVILPAYLAAHGVLHPPPASSKKARPDGSASLSLKNPSNHSLEKPPSLRNNVLSRRSRTSCQRQGAERLERLERLEVLMVWVITVVRICLVPLFTCWLSPGASGS